MVRPLVPLALILFTFLAISCTPPGPPVGDAYRAWAEIQAQDLATRTQGLAQAVTSGDLEGARNLILAARGPFERLDPVLEALGDSDTRLDADQEDVPPGRWTGFRALDRALADHRPTAELVALTRALTDDAQTLGHRLDALEVGPALLTSGSLELLGEIHDKKLPSLAAGDDRFGPGDLEANREGLAEIWGLLAPAVRQAHPDRAAAVDDALGALQTPGASWADRYDTLTVAWKAAFSPTGRESTADLGALKTPVISLDRALTTGDTAGARQALANLQAAWLAREALVRDTNPGAYAPIEAQIGVLRRELAADQPGPLAVQAVGILQHQLDGLKVPTGFTAWDAGFLLFREGLEALLVLAALVAFLGRTDQRSRTVWVWTGAGAGLAASVAVAFAISILLAGWASSTAPSLVEGVTGLAAVVLMLTVGAWLHGKASVKNWNHWLKTKMGQAGDSPWALGTLAFLAILREGAETVVFFWGLTGSLSTADLILGVTGALVVLVVLGILVIGFSKRLPLNWFFPLATALIYFLAVKILGQSLASLQSAGLVPTTALGFAGPVEGLGFSPTWETALPQILLTLVLGTLLALSLVKARPAPTRVGQKERLG